MVMNHDNTLDRTMRKASDYSKVTGNVRLDALTLKEIRRDYVLESTVPEFRVAPPTLEEFLLECKKCGICPMLHSSYSQAHRLATEIMGDNWVCFSSGDISIFKAVREYSNCTIRMDLYLTIYLSSDSVVRTSMKMKTITLVSSRSSYLQVYPNILSAFSAASRSLASRSGFVVSVNRMSGR